MKEYKKWQGASVVEPKLDGIYAKVTKDGAVTKTGKPIKSADHVVKAMRRHFKKSPGSVVEGELYRKGQDFEKTLGKFRGGEGKKLKLYVHGGDRPSRLTRHVRRVKGKSVKDEKSLQKAHSRNLRKLYEGSVIKRDGKAVKLKPKFDEELSVVGSKVRKDGKAGVVSVQGRDGRVFKAQGSAAETARAKSGDKATVVYQKSSGGSVRGAKLKSVRNREFGVRDFEADPRLARVGVSGFNQPKKTPGHAKKSHVVVVKEGGKVKVVRFGEQGAKVNQTVAQRKAFKSRHARNINRGKMSAAYWADKVKWSPGNTVNKKPAGESREFAVGVKKDRFKRILKVVAKKGKKKTKKVAAKLPIEVRRGAVMGAMIPVPGAMSTGAALGGAVVAKGAVERAVRKRTGRPYRLFEATSPVMSFEGQEPLKPGIYHGSRGVKALPIFKHEYVVAVPKDGRRVKRKLRKRLVNVNGSNVLVMGAYNKRGKLKANYKDKVDVEAFKKSVASGKGYKRVGKQMDTDRTMNKMVGAAGRYKSRRYPNTLANMTGLGKNSNSYARGLLKEGGVRKVKKSGVLAPGKKMDVGFDNKNKVMNLQPKDVKRLKTQEVRIKRDGLSKTRDAVDIGSKVAVGGGVLAGGLAVKKSADKFNSKAVADQISKAAKGKVKDAFPGFSRVARAMVKKRKMVKMFEAHEFGKAGQLRDQKTNQYADPLKAYRGKQKVYQRDVLGKPVNIENVNWNDRQVIGAAINKGKKVARYTGRAGNFARDAKDVVTGKERRKDAAGRKKKREWEKSYVKNAAATAAGGAAVIGYNATLKKNPKLKTKNKTINKGLKKVLGGYYGKGAETVDRSIKTRAWNARRSAIGKIGRVTSKYLGSESEVIEFDGTAARAGWDVRDPRGRSARVFAPGSRRRNRREKHWHEKKENQKKIWAAGTVAALLAGGAVGARIARRSGASVGKASLKGGKKFVASDGLRPGGRSAVAGSGKRVVKPRKRPDLRPEWQKRRAGIRPLDDIA